MTTPTPIRCQDCGMEGMTSKDDIVPGVCPDCFAKRITAAIAQIRADMTTDEALELLRATGLSEHGMALGRAFMTIEEAKHAPKEWTND